MINIKDYTDENGRFDGRYLLIRPLSTDGATADVWLSLDLNTVAITDSDKISKIKRMSDEEIEKLGLMVAIKIYRPQNALDVEGEQRFRDEYMIVFNCHHANLIHPTNFSICKDTPYLVLPYCKKGSSELLIGHKFTNDEIWKYIQDVASGLAYLHALDPPIVHQDVKPANVLLDDTGNFALTDFGISAQRGGVHGYYFDDDNSGTLAYMAPERFLDDTEPMPQSDIWGFGATLYEVLTGKVPFGEEGGRAQAKDVPMPSIPSVSADIQRLIHACLAKEPGNRPTAQQIADAARAKQYPIKSKKPLWLALAALALICIAASGYYFSHQKHEPDPVNQLPTKKERYEFAVQLLDKYQNPDSAAKGMSILDSLCQLKYVPALYEKARTIGPCFENVEQDKMTRRKRYLGIHFEKKDKDSFYWPTDSEYLASSVALHRQIINIGDSSEALINAKAAYQLGTMFLLMNGQKKDKEEILDLFDTAINWALIGNNTVLAKTITDQKGDAENRLKTNK